MSSVRCESVSHASRTELCYMRRYSALMQVYVRVYACICERCGLFDNSNNNNNNNYYYYYLSATRRFAPSVYQNSTTQLDLGQIWQDVSGHSALHQLELLNYFGS